MEGALLNKLYDIGVLSSAAAAGGKLSDVETKVTVSAFCRRRLAVVMCANLKMSESVSAAVKFVEQGHVRVGPDTVTDPAFLVTRHMEDFVTWVDTSKLKRTVMAYNDEVCISFMFSMSYRMIECVFSSSMTSTCYNRRFISSSSSSSIAMITLRAGAPPLHAVRSRIATLTCITLE